MLSAFLVIYPAVYLLFMTVTLVMVAPIITHDRDGNVLARSRSVGVTLALPLRNFDDLVALFAHPDVGKLDFRYNSDKVD
ncbi:uncharacterized protein ASPGLDRAFT_56409 [Aspergillus glaucus CBS 516.65]|uniref:Uncharacterized protein n=1 Tax=Aspergillus glaucus CBS 516.65 TaxID=1160497 RepID=A0A1L9VPI6_ASPGL|nr:hypothetical protein ASPGLDRAFT_56409 [Aspergillus glaucus CBS 516.65]OJJ85819.1 hypothetical protein ASPGLDRAFT_56409 [Aspergillus glaucus CBS 516.65]